MTTVKKVVGFLDGPSTACEFVAEMESLVNEISAEIRRESAPTTEERDVEQNKQALWQGGKICTEALVAVAFVPDCDVEKAKRVILGALRIAAHPLLANFDRSTWVRVVQGLKHDVRSFVRSNADDVQQTIYALSDPQSVENAVSLLAQIDAASMVPNLLAHVDAQLRCSGADAVELIELEIFRFPEGQLYDKTILSEERSEMIKQANMKRESKLYSFKDQLADLEIRKELEKKKAVQSGELTPKQRQAVQEQLAKETQIRARIKAVYESCSHSFAILTGVLDANAVDVPGVVCSLLDTLRYALQVPLIAERAVQSWAKLRECLFASDVLGYAVCYASLRLMKPTCALPKEWTDERIETVTERCLRALLRRVGVDAGDADGGEEAGDVEGGEFLTRTAFAYTFQLLRFFVGEANEGCERALVIVTAHLEKFAHEKALGGASDLPIEQMLDSLLAVLGAPKSSAIIRNAASSCLLSLARCVAAMADDTSRSLLNAFVGHLAEATTHSSEALREYSLRSLEIVLKKDVVREAIPKLTTPLAARAWVARRDENQSVVALADGLWTLLNGKLNEDIVVRILDNFNANVPADVQTAAAAALAEALRERKALLSSTLSRLLNLYKDKNARIVEPIRDDFGRVIVPGGVDEWQSRVGIARALKSVAPLLEGNKEVLTFFEALIPEAVLDRNADVARCMLEAATEAVKEHGKANIQVLLPMFENLLDACRAEKSKDSLRESIVVLMGVLAQHLDSTDPRVKPIVAKLMETLSTPSQPVQEAVANCLPPLISAIKDQASSLVEKLLALLLNSEQYGERRGAAYGIAGIVKGLGILSLKQLNIIAELEKAIQDKKSAKRREGALLAFEMLCNMLGRLFEPYVVHLLPHLLVALGDSDAHVRAAAEDCSKAVMRQLSAHGVKLVLPALLDALAEDSWRTKCGSVELLGSMAFCAPKQLSSCLPSVVPKLIEVLSDTHVRVQKAGEQALKQIAQVIRNPEIQAISDVLIAALTDPTKTKNSLNALLRTKFLHFMDAPSLALIMPVILRASSDRSSETRKMAAQIVGNIYALCDQKDVEPYLSSIVPGLKRSLLDPVPEVRAVAAKALGAVCKGMGEEGWDDLFPWLKSMLASETNSVDRSGAAQGLSEVLGGFGEAKLKEVMDEVLALIDLDAEEDVPPHVRDGHIMLFIYLPGVFGDAFLPYIRSIVPSLLHALADENEYVRETALKAGRVLINAYYDTAMTLLVPELERGLFDDNWRIRLSSVHLIGDLLFKISGVTGKMSTEGGEEDTFGTEVSSRAIVDALGIEHRNRILSGLYMARSDVALLVRQTSAHVWKVIVANTPRTLKEILPTLFSLLLGCLASSCYDKQQVAARCLGELTAKMGERILVDVVPVLERGLRSTDADQRKGVCIALSEIMAATTKDMVLLYAGNLIPTVRTALSDSNEEVRQAAAKTFDVLYATIGAAALPELMPLLEKLDDGEVGVFILDGLRRVVELKGKVVLPYLVPKLTTPPVNSHILSQLASVSGDILSKYLPRILPALLQSYAASIDTSRADSECASCLSVVLSVSDPAGVASCIDILLSAASGVAIAGAESTAGGGLGGDLSIRRAATRVLALYCQQTEVDLRAHLDQIVKCVFVLYKDENAGILADAAECLNAVTKSLDSKEQFECVSTIRYALRSAVASVKPPLKLLPGLCTPKGLAPVLAILRESVLNGGADLKESAAVVLSEVVALANEAGLKPHVINVTGPLIRILGDRFPPPVKTAILSTLALLLNKVGVMLKPFMPQLQSTFLKALADPSSLGVRSRAGEALTSLALIHPKLDTLALEIVAGAKSADDASTRETYVSCLEQFLGQVRDRLSDGCRQELAKELRTASFTTNVDEQCRAAVAECLRLLAGDA